MGYGLYGKSIDAYYWAELKGTLQHALYKSPINIKPL